MKEALIAVAVLGFAASTMAQTTVQFGPDVVVKAVKADGNATISWTDPLKVVTVEHYIGHGRVGGFIAKIPVGDAKQATLKDIVKNGGRFNLVTTDGKYLHLECGGNLATVMPKFEGVVNDCSFVLNGEKVGALVVQ